VLHVASSWTQVTLIVVALAEACAGIQELNYRQQIARQLRT